MTKEVTASSKPALLIRQIELPETVGLLGVNVNVHGPASSEEKLLAVTLTETLVPGESVTTGALISGLGETMNGVNSA
jgi:hypothetical protein